MTTWRTKIALKMAEHGESWADVSASIVARKPELYPDPDEPRHEPSFDREFDDGFGGSEGDAFTVWTERRVYFPVLYDGAESVGSAPRNPCSEACAHVGGE